MIKRTIIDLSRHAQKEKVKGKPDNEINLVDAAVPSLYEKSVDCTVHEGQRSDCTVKNSIGWHSPKIRTMQTVQAIIAGALGLKIDGRAPRNICELYCLVREHKIQTIQDERLNIDPYVVDETAFGELGEPEYLKQWAENLDATQLSRKDGGKYNLQGGVTPSRVCFTTVKNCLLDILVRTAGYCSLDPNDSKGLVVVSTSAGPIDLAMRAAYEATGKKYSNIEQVDGPFAQEEGFRLIVDQNNSGVYTATLKRKDKNYGFVDLSKLVE